MNKQVNTKKSLFRGLGFVTLVLLLTGLFSVMVFAAGSGTVTGSNVNVRSKADATSTAVGSLNTGDAVTINEEVSGADGNTWYKITSSTGINGYIRSDFVKKSNKTDNSSSDSSSSKTNVTTTDAKKAYIAGTGSVNIRKDASKNSDIVATAKGQSEVTVTGEATSSDGYKWYQIKFAGNGTEMTGFIRSDLITFTAPVAEPAETEIEGTMGEENPEETPDVEENPEEGESDEEFPEEGEEPEESGLPTPDKSSQGLDVLTPDGEPEIIPEGFQRVNINTSNGMFPAWAKGDFYILYANEAESDAAWYILDYKNGSYIRYEGLLSEADADKGNDAGSSLKTIVFILVGVIIVLLGVVTFLGLKLVNSGNDDDDYDDYDDGNDYDDDYEEEYEEPVKSSKKSKKESKPKKEKKEKKKFKTFFDDDDDEIEDYEEYDEDGDDINFIDL